MGVGGKILTYFSIAYTTLVILLMLLSLLLWLLTLTAVYPMIQTWKFRRACGRHVRGRSLDRLAEVYSARLRKVMGHLRHAWRGPWARALPKLLTAEEAHERS